VQEKREMRAVLVKEWGDPSSLSIERIETKVPGPGEALVAIHACGVNFADTLMIAGKYQIRPEFPFSPGLEIAGVVTQVGKGVTHLRPGTRVLGICDYGGYAEEVTVNASMLFPIPDEMDYVKAAAFPVAYGTSHLALEHRANLQPGEVLLVLGASGGVGLTAVEIGKRMGATIIAAASTKEKLKLTQKYGADYIINYTEENLRERVKKITGGRGADVIFDPVGGDIFDEAVRAINWEGRYLVIGFAAGRIPELAINLALVKNFSLVGVYWGAYAAKDPQVLAGSLEKLLGWYKHGALNPHISKTFSLENTADALNTLMNRKSTGKVVIKVRG